MFKYILSLFIVFSIFSGSHIAQTKPRKVAKPKPNIIYIYADDLGYAGLGSYGQQKIKTPKN